MKRKNALNDVRPIGSYYCLVSAGHLHAVQGFWSLSGRARRYGAMRQGVMWHFAYLDSEYGHMSDEELYQNTCFTLAEYALFNHVCAL